MKTWILVFTFLLPLKAVLAQNEGFLFMLPDNYQAQILNPSYFNNEGTILALPGFAGLSLSNDANFRITDLVYTKSSGQTVYDLGRFSEKSRPINRNTIHLSLPLLYLGIPVRDGMISFYLQERANISVRFPGNSITWLDNGNLPEEYRNFQSGDIRSRMLGYHELALGYARRVNDKFHFGIRGKLLFGELFVLLNNWNFGLETAMDGNEVLLASRGSGLASIPYSVLLDSNGKYQNIEVNNILPNYLSVRNPGFAFDGGITVEISEKKRFSASVKDLGLIYFNDNGWNFYQNDAHVFRGIDISNSVNSKLGTDGYIFPFYLMTNVKDTLKNVYKPIFKSRNFFRGPSPQIFLHYQNKYNESFTYGFTNRTVLQKTYLLNTLSFNVLKQTENLSFIGDLSLHGLSSLTVGSGLQWNMPFAQLFVFTDNLLAIYHPAAQKSYAITFGLNFLLKQVENEVRDDYSRKGKFSKYFPFFRNYRK